MKRNIITYAVLISALLVGYSCSREEDDLFDKSSAERMAEALKQYKEILVGAPNGWVMEYYIGESPDRSGGYTYLCSFSADNTVTMATEFDIAQHAAKDKVSSLYHLKSDQSAVLSFDTYNPIFHYYSEPHGSANPSGKGGDYEFVLKEVTSEEIIMIGKKHDYKIRMTPLAEGTTWDSYIDRVMEMAETNYFPRYKVIVNGTEQPYTAHGRYKTRRMLFSTDGGTDSWGENMYYTAEGFKFYEPVAFGEKEASNFELRPDNSFVCTDPDVDVVLKGYYPENYMYMSDLEGAYRMAYNNFENSPTSVKVTLTEIPGTYTMLLENATYYPLIMEYDRDNGCVNFISQYAGEYRNMYPTYLYMWLGGTGLIPLVTDDFYMRGISNGDKVNTVITFQANDPMSRMVGVLLVMHINDGYGLLTANDCLRDISFVRQ